MVRISSTSLLLFLIIFLVACASQSGKQPPLSSGRDGEASEHKPVSTLYSPLIGKRDYPGLLKQQLNAVYAMRKPERRLAYIEDGRQVAENCLSDLKSNLYTIETERAAFSTACLYYRIVFTGLYYKAKVVGYQKGLKKMIADAELLMAQNPAYEEGGVYRILGNIYLKTPNFSLKSDAILKDLQKAEQYADEALRLAPDNPENLLLKGEVLWEKGDREAARAYFKTAKEKLPRPDRVKRREEEILDEVKGYLGR